ncbi:hypothetical protein ACFQ1E_19885 [Sphingomonas canadensis]|uniref:Uncharacterized protein n=1 Tax=Sphingomonas canadensis TaxID=1219257 RepID=A0ABW3HDA4_9SPHN|nr:hypothetical protein [Sphingomonas canadensis]MCW3838310.1 hypothetical protein [Sphingomonas canadensis]
MQIPPAIRPSCPFCRAEWTDAMLAQFDAYTVAASCACCGHGETAHVHGDAPEVPLEDICCAACGRAIYLKPQAAAR